MIDLDKLTLGEIATIESLAERSINTMEQDEAPKGRMLAAIAMIAKRRDGDPRYTFNQALALTVDEANAIIGLEEDDEDGADDLEALEPEPPGVRPAEPEPPGVRPAEPEDGTIGEAPAPKARASRKKS